MLKDLPFVLPYKIEGLPGNITDSPVIGEDFKSASFSFMNTKVYYEVVLAPYSDPRNYWHLYIDNIEVVDVDIWERHGNQISTLNSTIFGKPMMIHQVYKIRLNTFTRWMNLIVMTTIYLTEWLRMFKRLRIFP
ncbi:MAG: hypothetical protein IPG53_08190 [Ignavibacteriales bacterium]|nr:hypothetical protein [Ignavibacteriales bacterium]